MKDTYRELMEAMHMFHRLNISLILPHLSKNEFYMMRGIQHMEQQAQEQELPGIAMSKLAKMVHALPPAVSRTIKSLEERGYVERYVSRKDRRNTMVRLTEEGKEVVAESRKIMEAFAERVFAQTDEEELKRACAYFRSLYETADEEIKKMKISK